MYALTDSRIKSLLLNGLSNEERKKFKTLPVESQVEILDTLQNKSKEIERQQMEQRKRDYDMEEMRKLYPSGSVPPHRAVASENSQQVVLPSQTVEIPYELKKEVNLPEQSVEVPYKTTTSPDTKNLSEVSKMNSLEYAKYYLEQQRLKEEKDRALSQEIENRIQAIQNMRI